MRTLSRGPIPCSLVKMGIQSSVMQSVSVSHKRGQSDSSIQHSSSSALSSNAECSVSDRYTQWPLVGMATQQDCVVPPLIGFCGATYVPCPTSLPSTVTGFLPSGVRAVRRSSANVLDLVSPQNACKYLAVRAHHRFMHTKEEEAEDDTVVVVVVVVVVTLSCGLD